AESDSLDFKRDQYPLIEIGQKAELVKDVLAFANSWATEDRYILIGVKEERSGRHTVVGIEEHLDEADLQQLVNEKTNQPIDFQYFTQTVDGLTIGIVRVPRGQNRPFFLRKQFASLKPNEVRVRRGSSTAIATPDEIARMGRASVPSLTVPEAELTIVELPESLLATYASHRRSLPSAHHPTLNWNVWPMERSENWEHWVLATGHSESAYRRIP